MRGALACHPKLSVPSITARQFVDGNVVLIVNVALVAPAGTVTVDGTVTLLLLLVSVIGHPLVGAVWESTTVAVELAPP